MDTVLYFTKGYTPHDFNFISTIVSYYKVAYLTLEDFDIEERPFPEGVHRVSWPCGGKFINPEENIGSKFGEVIAKVKPIVVHAGPILTCTYVAALSSGSIPIVAVSWGYDIMKDYNANLTNRMVGRWTLERCHAVICDCQPVEDVIARLTRAKIFRFPWGINLSLFTGREAGKDKKLLPTSEYLNFDEEIENPFIILSLRNHYPVYNLETLIKAFLAAAIDIPNICLIVGGDGALRGELEDLVDNSSISCGRKRIKFTGCLKRNEVKQAMLCSDLYVSTSLTDGSSVTLLEAMACNMPVLVSDIPGNREWVQSGVNGFLFPAKDTDALKENIFQLSSLKEEELVRLGSAGRRKVEEKGNWETNRSKIIMSYQHGLALKGSY